MTIATFTTIPATTQQAMLSAAGSAKRAASTTGHAATYKSMKLAMTEIESAIEKLSAARNDIETLMRRASEDSK